MAWSQFRHLVGPNPYEDRAAAAVGAPRPLLPHSVGDRHGQLLGAFP